jgi:putative DNA primase/helicase
MRDVKQEAIGHWRHILLELGIDAKHLGTNKPCPACGGSDRFSFSDKEGLGTWYCRSCNGGSGFDLLMLLNGWDFVTAAKNVQRVLGVPEKAKPFKPQRDPAQALNRVWLGSKPVRRGDQASQYLQARGLSVLPESLRLHPGLRTEGKTYPALIALVQDVKGRKVTLHRTFLDGPNKAPLEAPKKLMPGKATVTGCCIRLWPADTEVVISEGVETTCAASELFSLPGWAAVSAHGLEALQLPETIRSVLIAGDHDKNYVGLKAAYVLAERLHREGRTVRVSIPPVPQMDWLDELNLRRGKAA